MFSIIQTYVLAHASNYTRKHTHTRTRTRTRTRARTHTHTHTRTYRGFKSCFIVLLKMDIIILFSLLSVIY